MAVRKKPARLVKGSAAAKRHMAKIRAMRGTRAKGAKKNPRRRVRTSPTRKTAAKRTPVRRRKNPGTYKLYVELGNGKRMKRTFKAASHNDARAKMRAAVRKLHPRAAIKRIQAVDGKTVPEWYKRNTSVRKKNPAKRTPGRPKRTAKKAAVQATSPMYRTKPSQRSGRKPSRRLMSRRARNTRPGTFPNPTAHVIFGVRKTDGKLGYFNGIDAFETSKGSAISYPSFQTAVKAARALAKKAGGRYVIGAASRNATVADIRKKVEG